MPYDTAVIRELLSAAFSDEQFTIFCFDNFHSVTKFFSTKMSFSRKIHILIEHCERNLLFDDLVNLVKKENLKQYNRFRHELKRTDRIPEQPINSQKTYLKITFPDDLSHLTFEQKFTVVRAAIGAVAGALDIPPDTIELEEFWTGSITLKVRLPIEAADRLLALYAAGDPVIQDLGIHSISTISGQPSEAAVSASRESLGGVRRTFEFVNREYELDQICKPGSHRFILVDGAAGFGKSHLLREVQRRFEEKKRPAWKTALIDLKSEAEMVSTDSRVAWPCIGNTILQQFDYADSNIPSVPANAREEVIAGILVPSLVNQKTNILLLFDGIEVLSRETSTWLKHLVLDLDEGLKIVNSELRAVFAGRYVGDWDQDALYPLPVLTLSPFDHMAIRDMIDQVVQAASVRARLEFLDELASWTLLISGGHPQGICDVLKVIREVGFVLPNLEFTFQERKFQRGNEEGTLFDLWIEPILNKHLQSVPPVLHGALDALCPIRRFDQELLDELLKEEVFAAPDGKSSWDIIKGLLKTRLIKPPTAADPMFSDQIVRRMLAMRMRLQDSDRFWEINTQALAIFDEWARGQGQQGPVDAQVRRVAVVECLYHILQVERRVNSPKDVYKILEQKLEEYLEGIGSVREFMQLKDALANDKEFNDLIGWWIGGSAGPALLRVVESYSG
jgi:hypothetical protein